MKKFLIVLVALPFLFYAGCSELEVTVEGYVVDIINGVTVDQAVVIITDGTTGSLASDEEWYGMTFNGYFAIDTSLTTDNLNIEIYKAGCYPYEEKGYSTSEDSNYFFIICP